MTLKQITDTLLSLNRLKKLVESVWKIQYLNLRRLWLEEFLVAPGVDRSALQDNALLREHNSSHCAFPFDLA